MGVVDMDAGIVTSNPTINTSKPATDKNKPTADTNEPAWFKGDGEDEHHPRILQDPEEVKVTHQLFKEGLRRILKKDNSRVASTEAELFAQITQIRNAYKTTSQDRMAAVQGFNEASRARDMYQKRRQEGTLRFAHRIQAFANGIAEFITAYSGIIELVRGAGGPYGEVGYQTLSILLIVFVNKNDNDTKILEMLNEIRKSLPRLKSWKDIYPTPEMKELVASAYKLVTEFSRAAVQYFARFGRRVLAAVVPTMSSRVDGIAACIHKCLAEINSEAMIGLHIRSQKIQQQIQKFSADKEKMLMEIRDLTTENRVLQRKIDMRWIGDDKRKLEDLEDILGIQVIPEGPNTSNVAVCKETLQGVFPNSLPFSPGRHWAAYIQMSPQRLQQCDEFRHWSACKSSCLLFLSGSTEHHGRKLTGFPHSWLSPAAIYIAEDRMRTAGENVAFFSCQLDTTTGKTKAAVIISSVVSQILNWKPEILQERDVEFRRIISESERRHGSNSSEEDLILRGRVSLLKAVLSNMKGIGMIYLVLDRMDQCETPINDLMNELSRLLVSQTVMIKIVVVVETSCGNGNWELNGMNREIYHQVRDRLFIYKNWNQRLLTYQESSGRHLQTWDNGHVFAV
ncbi:hypothetical protein NUW58_g5232 [Xylaria curta]|uniref:Uncharacterized protein n=1 Tax=Xylaria curta TaxID=42375 RepID=A0ACC1P2Q1_9PEZI|nr:hypothetical protein NUW58_g5232 [Xylaria curta]